MNKPVISPNYSPRSPTHHLYFHRKQKEANYISRFARNSRALVEEVLLESQQGRRMVSYE